MSGKWKLADNLRNCVSILRSDQRGAALSIEKIAAVAVAVLILAAVLKMAINRGGAVDQTGLNLAILIDGKPVTGGSSDANASGATPGTQSDWSPPTLAGPNAPAMSPPSATPIPQPLPTPTPGPSVVANNSPKDETDTLAVTGVVNDVAGALLEGTEIAKWGSPEVLSTVGKVKVVSNSLGPAISLIDAGGHLINGEDREALKAASGGIGGWAGGLIGAGASTIVCGGLIVACPPAGAICAAATIFVGSQAGQIDGEWLGDQLVE